MSQPDERRTWAALLGLGAAFAAAVGGLQLARLARFEPQSFDLAIYAQLVWNAGHGAAWSSVQQAPALGVHLTPWLLALGPLTRVCAAAPLLVGVQALALGGLAPLLYLVLRPYGGRRAAWVAACALLYPPLWSLALADFHPLVLGCPLSLALVWALERPRPRLAWALALALAALVHEVYPLVLVGLGPACWLRGRPRQGLALTGLGLVAFGVGSLGVLPALRGDALGIEQVYGHLGEGPLQVVLSPLLRPGAFFGHVLSSRHVVWLLGLLLPLGGLPLLRPTWLLPAVPVLALHALSIRATQQDLAFHYHAPLIPWLLLAAGWACCGAPAASWARWASRAPAGRPLRAAWLLGWALSLGLAQLGPLQRRGLSPEPWPALADALRPADPRAAAVRRLLALVPADAPALGSVDLLAPLADRAALWGMPGVVRGLKDWSQVAYAPPPPDAWVLANTAEGPRSFWVDLPRPHPALEAAARRWRALALPRRLEGVVEGTLLLGPRAGPGVVAPLPPSEPVVAPAIAGWAPRPALPAGVVGVGLELALPADWRAPLWIEARYLDAAGRELRRAQWPALYRLFDQGPHPQRVEVMAGLLRLGACAELRLLTPGAQPIPGPAIPLE